jgi:hypothetical protein
MGCSGCGRGFHEECESDCKECHGEVDSLVKSFNPFKTKGVAQKDPSKIGDPYSTGRKRAAVMYPIFKTNPCEWRGKKNCGGGTPIVGCIEGLQVDRHHGPVKNPLRNEPGNVHRICKDCHNRWHVINDPLYDESTYDQTKHSPEPATELELIANHAHWKVNK